MGMGMASMLKVYMSVANPKEQALLFVSILDRRLARFSLHRMSRCGLYVAYLTRSFNLQSEKRIQGLPTPGQLHYSHFFVLAKQQQIPTVHPNKGWEIEMLRRTDVAVVTCWSVQETNQPPLSSPQHRTSLSETRPYAAQNIASSKRTLVRMRNTCTKRHIESDML